MREGDFAESDLLVPVMEAAEKEEAAEQEEEWALWEMSGTVSAKAHLAAPSRTPAGRLYFVTPPCPRR